MGFIQILYGKSTLPGGLQWEFNSPSLAIPYRRRRRLRQSACRALRASAADGSSVNFLVCGTTSENICDDCSARLRIEALNRKKHEEQGDASSHCE